MKNILKIILILLAYNSHAQYAIEYKFDELQRIKEEKYPDGTTVTYTYDPVSNRKTKVVNRVVAGQPDITLLNSSLSVSSIVVGNNLTVSTTVSNLQTTAANPNFKIRYYLSNNNLYEVTDTELGTFQTITAPFTGTQNLQNVITIPTGQVGSKHIIIRADADNEVTNEVSETNNEVAFPIQINAPCGIISVIVNTTNVNNGGSNGSATAVASGGQSPYNFVWNNGGTSSIINNLSSGNYSVSVTDANGCQGAGNGVVSNVNVCNLAVTASTTEASCNAADGAINISVSGGTMPYSYAWSNGITTEDLTNVASNDYFVQVTDANQCKTTANFWVGIKGVVVSVDTIKLAQKIWNYTELATALVENNSMSKLIISDFNTGTQPVQLSAIDLINKTNTTVQFTHPSGQAISKLNIASSGDTLLLLGQYALTSPNVATSIFQLKFNGTQNPVIQKEFNISTYQHYRQENMTFPFYYLRYLYDKAVIYNKGTNYQNEGNLTSFDLYDFNTNQASVLQNTVVWPHSTEMLTWDKYQNNKLLITQGKLNNIKKVHVFGNVSNNFVDQGYLDLKKIPFRLHSSKNGYYSIGYSDGKDSIYIETYDKNLNFLGMKSPFPKRDILATELGYSTSGKPILLISTYEFSGQRKLVFWDCEAQKILNEKSLPGNSSHFQNTYRIHFSEKLKKFVSVVWWYYKPVGQSNPLYDDHYLFSYQVNDGPSVQSQITDTPYNTSNGAINLTISGGSASFLWSNGATTEDVSGLSEGTYSVTITQTGGGCPIIRSFQIKTNTAPPAPIISSDPNPAVIVSGANSSVTLTATNCTGTIKWSNGDNGNSIIVFPTISTSYRATCTYAGLESQPSMPITVTLSEQVTPPIISTTKTTICVGEVTTLFASNCNGIITWSNGQTGNSLEVNDIQNTIYNATCTLNSLSSQNSNSIEIVVKPVPLLTANIINASCGVADGSIVLTVSNASEPLSYLWSNGATSKDISNIPQSSYFVNVTDVYGCKAVGSYDLGNNSIINLVETFDLPVRNIFENSYDLMETPDFSKILFTEASALNQPLVIKSLDLGTKNYSDISIQQPNGLSYRAFGVSTQNNNLIVLQQFVSTPIAPGYYSVANGFSDISFDSQFNPTYNKTRYLDGFLAANQCGTNGQISFNSYKKIGNEIFTLKSQQSTTGGFILDLNRYNFDIQSCGYQQSLGSNPIEYLKPYSIIRNPNTDGFFILGGDKLGNKWIDGFSTVNGIYSKTSEYFPTRQPMHLSVSGTKHFLVTKTKNSDNSLSHFLQVYDNAFQFLSEIPLPTIGNIIDTKVGKSTTGNDIICIAYDGYKLTFVDATNYKYIKTISATTEFKGLVYSNTYKKFISLHPASIPNLGKGNSYQVNDGIIVTSVYSDTPYGTNNGGVNLTISGGEATFLWSNGSTTEDISNLGEGTYSVTITPTGGGCPIIRSFQIKTNTAPPAPIVSAPNGTKILENSGGFKTLTSTGCSGITTWSTGETTTEIKVNPNQLTTFTATCSYNGYTSESSLPITISIVTPCLSMVSITSGLWNDPTIWSCGRIPDLNDDVTIASSHTIIIPKDFEAFCKNMNEYGNLLLNINSVLTIGSSNTLNSGMVLYLPFYGNAQDLSGNNNHGTVFGANLVTDRHGNENRAYRFDGVDDWIDTPIQQNNLLSYSISAWVKTDMTQTVGGNYYAIAQTRGATNLGGKSLTMGYDKNLGQWFFAMDTDFIMVGKSIQLDNNNQWMHITGTWSAIQGALVSFDQFNIYINGRLQSTQNYGANFGLNNVITAPFSGLGFTKIGYHEGWNSYFPGTIDDIRIYENKALNDLEVLDIYDLEKPKIPNNGLMAYYDFNGNLLDKSGNNNHGTSTSTKTFFTGNEKLAVKINGTGNVGTTGEFLSLPPLMTAINSNYSISIWVKEDGMSHFHGDGYIWFGDHYGPHIGIGHMLENIEFLNQTNFNDPPGRITIPFQNQWLRKYNHYLMTFENGKLKCFINGVKVGEKQNLANVSPNNNAGMGTHWFVPDASNRFIGNFDNTRIYKRALTEEEVSIIYNEEKSKVTDNQLVAYYPFNSNAEDESNAGNHLVNTNATLASDRNSTPNSAFYFNGTSKLISPNVSYLYNRSFTISFWAKPDSYTGQMFIRSGPPATSAALHIALRNENIFTFAFYSNDFDFTNFKKDNAWHNYTMIYNKELNLRSIYEDGIFLESQVCTIPLNAQNTPLILGYSWYDNYVDHLKGYLDDIRIYERALFEHEVRAIYEFEKP